MRILRSTPFVSACISMVALSVSISASGSPIETVSPSFLSHRAICPSSMVGESLGIITLLAIQNPQPEKYAIKDWRLVQVCNFTNCRDDLVHVWYCQVLKIL